MSTAVVLILALLLDAALGEPKWLWDRLPHPVVVMGRAVGWLDRKLNPARGGVLVGALALALLMAGAYGLGWFLELFGPIVEILVLAVLVAQRSLVQHVAAVARGLRVSLGDGRRAVAMIVSRDTAQMDQSAVARSAIESAAENMSDGVIAPVFWFLAGGLPALLVYKIVNTADSMIAYRTPKYEYFGKATAYADDILNFIPARITAGWPEAAMAHAISVALAGPRSYDGKMQQFAWVGGTGARTIGPIHIDAAIRQLWLAWGLMVGLVVLLGLL